MKKNWFLIINFLFTISIANIFLISAEENITFSSPYQVIEEDEFDLTISLNNFNEDNYDIKFGILDGTKNIAQRLWNGEWKSTNFWMEDAINTSENNQNTFKLKINKDYYGTREIIVKIRSTSDFVWEFDKNYVNVSSNNQNNNKENDQSDSTETEGKIYVELNWDEKKIKNYKEFGIEINIFNLKDEEYDIKIWIEDNEDNTISDRYDYENEDWKSGIFYLNNLFKGPGNETEEIDIKLREQYSDFEGDAKIFFKIRNGLEISEDIEILKKKIIEEPKLVEIEDTNVLISEDKPIAKEVIKLGSKKNTASENLKTEYSTEYESKTEIIKKYSIYFFALLCAVICVLFGWSKL